MNLILTLSNPDLLPDSLRTRQIEFNENGGTIGRNQDCDWVLEDPDRYVSSRHVRLTCKGDVFFAEDTSTNGTYLNDELIGKGKRSPIATGDVLRVGRFNISVEQRDGEGQRVGGGNDGRDLLADTQSGRAAGDDLLGNAGDPSEIDPFIGQPMAEPGADMDLMSDAQPLGGVQDSMGGLGLGSAGLAAAGAQAIPEDWMNADAKPSAEPVPVVQTVAPEDGDFGLTPVPAEAIVDMAPEPEAKPKTKPKAKPVAKAKPNSKPKPAPKAKAAEKPEPKPKTKPKPKPKPKAKAKPKPAPTSVEPVMAEPATVQPVAASIPAPAPTFAPAPRAPAPEPRPTAPAPVPAYANVDGGDFFAGFAQATGLSADAADYEAGQRLGGVLSALLDGTLNSLDARSRMQEELRLKGTMVGARENNPLKFSINARDAIGRLLQGEETGFKAPVPAAQEAMENLTSHQLGVLNGIDAGVKALLGTLDPKTVAVGKTAVTGPGMVKSLSAHHAKITEQTVERRDGVFWRTFTEAYKAAVAMAQSPSDYRS